MPINDEFEITDKIDTATTVPLVITWTADEPTVANTQTIADGDTPTVAETGQYIANSNAQITQLIADLADIRTKLNS